MARSAAAEEQAGETIGNPPASAVVAEALRERILRGALKGGERLRQDAFAGRFGVSQTIMREAFGQLVAEGFLKAEPRRGVAVARLSADEAAEITGLRALLEPQALAWAIPRLSKADLEGAGRILTELDKARSTDRILALNARFHEMLYAPAGRERTLSLIATLRLTFERYLRFTWEETPHRARSQDEHAALLAACAAGKADKACALLRQHILATGALLAERLKARPAT